MAISPGEALLKIINLRDGELIADLAIDLSEIGEVAAFAIGDRDDSIVVLGAAGIAEIALKKPTAREIVIADGQASRPCLVWPRRRWPKRPSHLLESANTRCDGGHVARFGRSGRAGRVF